MQELAYGEAYVRIAGGGYGGLEQAGYLCSTEAFQWVVGHLQRHASSLEYRLRVEAPGFQHDNEGLAVGRHRGLLVLVFNWHAGNPLALASAGSYIGGQHMRKPQPAEGRVEPWFPTGLTLHLQPD